MRLLEEMPDTGLVMLAHPGVKLGAIEDFGRQHGVDCYVLSDLVPPGQVFVIDVDRIARAGWTL